jgi:putative FmdB family regulatory protein
MPIYQYHCVECETSFKQMHAADEAGGVCDKCNKQATKDVTKSNLSIINKPSQTSAGQRVEKFIEESREVLQEQLKDARKELKI